MSRPVDINRALRRAGLLEVHTQDGMEYLDTMASRAFAVADHQLAHIYVRRPEDLEAVRAALADLPGIDQLLDDEGKKAHHLDHPAPGSWWPWRRKDAWFTYYYWLDDARAPDFAQLVEIHRKPGYDPVELFMDPEDPYVRLKAVSAVARKKLGMRYRMAVVPWTPHLFAAATAASPRATTKVRSSSAPPPRVHRPGQGHRGEVPAPPACRTALTIRVTHSPSRTRHRTTHPTSRQVSKGDTRT